MSDATGSGYETSSRNLFGNIVDLGAGVWDSARKTFLEFGELRVEQAKIDLEKARIDAEKSNLNTGTATDGDGNIFGNVQAGTGIILGIIIIGFGIAIMRN